MRKALTLLAIASLGGALVAAGCGGDDDDDTTSAATTATTGATGTAGGEPLSKQEFASEADAICKQGDKEINQEAHDAFAQEG
jgi:ABC-type glycerol-3-phosphate transport system substrate-binding protein